MVIIEFAKVLRRHEDSTEVLVVGNHNTYGDFTVVTEIREDNSIPLTWGICGIQDDWMAGDDDHAFVMDLTAALDGHGTIVATEMERIAS